MNVALFVLLCAAEFADILTTNVALGRGMTELNPIYAAFQAHLGWAWWLPKLSVIAVGAWALLLLDLRGNMWFAAFVVAVMWIPVVSNTLMLLG